MPILSQENGDLSQARRTMVERTIVARGVNDASVLEAMLKVPRHKFVPKSVVAEAYEDSPLPIGYNQTISQPYIVALMVQLAELGPASKVLEIGTGSGYQVAVLSEITNSVFSVEIVPELMVEAIRTLTGLGYTNAHLRHGDGYFGWPEEAPFDAIIVSAAPPSIPNILLEQLAIGGRLVVPVGQKNQMLQVALRREDGFELRDIIPVRFVPMIH